MPAAHTLSCAPLPRSILPLHLQARQQQGKRDSCILYTSKDEQLQQIILLYLSPIGLLERRGAPRIYCAFISSTSSPSWPTPHQPVMARGSPLHLPHPKHSNPPTFLHLRCSPAAAHMALRARSRPVVPLRSPHHSMLSMLALTPWPILLLWSRRPLQINSTRYSTQRLVFPLCGFYTLVLRCYLMDNQYNLALFFLHTLYEICDIYLHRGSSRIDPHLSSGWRAYIIEYIRNYRHTKDVGMLKCLM